MGVWIGGPGLVQLGWNQSTCCRCYYFHCGHATSINEYYSKYLYSNSEQLAWRLTSVVYPIPGRDDKPYVHFLASSYSFVHYDTVTVPLPVAKTNLPFTSETKVK
jgi:hypothetical protein